MKAFRLGLAVWFGGCACLAGAVNNVPKWTGSTSLSYGLDVSTVNHSVPSAYRHALWGVYQSYDGDAGWTESDADLSFSKITNVAARTNELFISKSKTSLSRHLIPSASAEWKSDELVVPFSGGLEDAYLFRYHHFENGLKDASGSVVPVSTSRLILLIHGWNDDENVRDPYKQGDLKNDFGALSSKLRAAVSGTNWIFQPYDWARDAETGSSALSYENKVEASEIAVLHGLHVGESLAKDYPSLEKVHFIAAGAGAWCARAATRHLLKVRPAVKVQVTLLDPFMPKVAAAASPTTAASNLGPSLMGDLDDLDAARGISSTAPLHRLENYYSWEPTSVGTSSEFGWSKVEASEVKLNAEGFAEAANYTGKAGPIRWYADTVAAETNAAAKEKVDEYDLTQVGWRRSLFHNEPVIETQPADVEALEGTWATFSVKATTRERKAFGNEAKAEGFVYRWYRKTDGEFQLQKETSGDSHGINPLTAAHAGVWRVTVSNGAGEATSAEFTLTMRPRPADVPPDVKVAEGNASLVVSWSAAAEAVRYEVFRNRVPSIEGAERVGVTAKTSFEDGAVAPGIAYHYFVRSVTAAGKSLFLWPVTQGVLPVRTPSHAPAWSSASVLTYNLPVPGESIDHKSYESAKWGVHLSKDEYGLAEKVSLSPDASLSFSPLTLPHGPDASQDDRDLFLSEKRDSLARLLFPSDTEWEWNNHQVVIPLSDANANKKDHHLFRYLHFDSPLREPPEPVSDGSFPEPGEPWRAGERKLVILIHGHNGASLRNPYLEGHQAELAESLQRHLTGTDWTLRRYDWARDADTGTSSVLTGLGNAIEAAHVAYHHGLHLGQTLEKDFSRLERAHFIAFGSGAWAARSAVRHLAATRPQVSLQVTLLSPFTPGEVPLTDTPLGKSLMDGLDDLSPDSLRRMENYYAAADLTLGTGSTFAWNAERHLNLRVNAGVFGVAAYSSEEGPAEWYADTALAALPGRDAPRSLSSADLANAGWRRSLFMLEPLILKQPSDVRGPSGGAVALSAEVATRESLLRPGSSEAGRVSVRWQRLAGGVFQDLPGATATTLVLTGLDANATGTYRMVATTAGGETASAAASVTLTADGAPEAPLGLSVGSGSFADAFSLRWEPVPGATGYAVYLEDNGSAVLKVETNRTFATVELNASEVSGGVADFRVAAIGPDANSSLTSAVRGSLRAAATDHSVSFPANGPPDYGLNLPDEGIDRKDYGYVRWGNLRDSHSYAKLRELAAADNLVKLDVGKLTASKDELFLSASLDSFRALDPPPAGAWAGWKPGESFQLTFPSAERQHHLFRKLHFESDLREPPVAAPTEEGETPVYDLPGERWDKTARKLILLVHGYNFSENRNQFATSEAFVNLERELEGALAEDGADDWRVYKYDWSRDSDTGSLFTDLMHFHQPTEAAEIGFQHGHHLAQALARDFPELEKVQVFAHSAGSWVARSLTARLLRDHPDALVHVTLLDPYMPNAIPIVNSSLGSPLMGLLDNLPNAGERIHRLENYYALEPSLGTESTFDWTETPSVNLRVFPTTRLKNKLAYASHDGPTQWYADTVAAVRTRTPVDTLVPFDLGESGWRLSLYRNEPIPTRQPQDRTADRGEYVALSFLAETREGRDGFGREREPPAYRWWRLEGDGERILVPGADASTLAFPSVRTEDAGEYLAEAYNRAGRVESRVVTLTVGEVSASGPGNLRADYNATAGTLRLSWDAVPGATGYQVLRVPHGSESPSAPILRQTTSTFLVETSLPAGSRHLYEVRATDGNKTSPVASSLVARAATESFDHSFRKLAGGEPGYGLLDLDPERDLKAYRYARWGNLQDSETLYNPIDDLRLDKADPDFSWLTKRLDKSELFVSESLTHFREIPIPGDADWDWPAVGSRSTGEVTFDATADELHLFRKLHFETDLREPPAEASPDEPGQAWDLNASRLVILVHGYNFSANRNQYEGSAFEELEREIEDAFRRENGESWSLFKYDWSRDSDTGGIAGGAGSEDFALLAQPTEAAEIGFRHGQHLGEVLERKFPNLEKVHIFAHSAGSWVARSATRHLLARQPQTVVQTTLLDPFMPNAAPGVDSSLGKPLMSLLDEVEGASERLYRLENYYSVELTLGTHSTFDWREVPSLNLRVNFAGSRHYTAYSSHEGPIQWFAETARSNRTGEVPERLRPFDLSENGWNLSLFRNEPVLVEGPEEVAAAPGGALALTAPFATRHTLQYPASRRNPLGYVWSKWKDDKFEEIPGATGAELRIDDYQASHAGVYRVLAYNRAGRALSPSITVVTDANATPAPVATLPAEVSPLPARTFASDGSTGNPYGLPELEEDLDHKGFAHVVLGNLQDSTGTLSPGDRKSLSATRLTESTSELFLSASLNERALVDGNLTDLEPDDHAHFPVRVEVNATSGLERAHLFRKHHFEQRLRDPPAGNAPAALGQAWPPDAEKLAVLIHGWNPMSARNQFEGADFRRLETQLRAAFDEAPTGWKLVKYDWSRDSDTGFSDVVKVIESLNFEDAATGLAEAYRLISGANENLKSGDVIRTLDDASAAFTSAAEALRVLEESDAPEANASLIATFRSAAESFESSANAFEEVRTGLTGAVDATIQNVSEGDFPSIPGNAMASLSQVKNAKARAETAYARATEALANAKQAAIDTYRQAESSAFRNAAEAAHVGHLHGLHLGETLNKGFPNLRKVHFFAHSAGSWCARSALKYLLEQGDDQEVVVQLTLLDPFMPGAVPGVDSPLGPELMGALDDHPANRRIVRLENFYSVEPFLAGTHETFAWDAAPSQNLQVNYDLVGLVADATEGMWSGIRETLSGDANATTNSADANASANSEQKASLLDLIPPDSLVSRASGLARTVESFYAGDADAYVYTGHNGPIRWYADTIEAARSGKPVGGLLPFHLPESGWRSSLFASEPFFTLQPADLNATAGEGAELRAEASTVARLRHRDNPLRQSEWKWERLVNGGWQTVEGVRSGELAFDAVTAEDAGLYRAVVANRAGTEVSRPARLQVTSAGGQGGQGSAESNATETGPEHKLAWAADGFSLSYGLPVLEPELDFQGYEYTRWGNLQDSEKLQHVVQVGKLGKADPDFTWLTENKDELFLSSSLLNPRRLAFPADAEWTFPEANSTKDGEVIFDVDEDEIHLFRAHHFENPLKDPPADGGKDSNRTAWNVEAKRLFILVHGYNPFSARNQYLGDEFSALENNLKAAIARAGASHADWEVVKYDWSRDSDTGGMLEDDFATAFQNATEAAHAGYQHGIHLGQVLAKRYPNLEKVHFLAHSAGSWCARSATLTLLKERPDVRLQVSLLDPFMPNEIMGINSPLGKNLMDLLDDAPGAHRNLYRLENFYSVNPETHGTGEEFAWNAVPSANVCVNPDLGEFFAAVAYGVELLHGIKKDTLSVKEILQDFELGYFKLWSLNKHGSSLRDDLENLHALGQGFNVPLNAKTYWSHNGPILWYAHSVEAAGPDANATPALSVFDLAKVGWRRSLFVREPFFEDEPADLTLLEGQALRLAPVVTNLEAKIDANSTAAAFTFHWSKRAESGEFDPLFRSLSPVFAKAEALPADSGAYRLTVTNDAGEAIGRIINVTVRPDRDRDGLDDDEEQQLGTNPDKSDTDADGFTDVVEVAAGTDPKDGASWPNRPPNGLNLVGSVVAENRSAGEIVGRFHPSDPDDPQKAGRYSFGLVDGNGSTDNDSFTVDEEGVLRSKRAFDYETQARLSIRVKVRDEVNATLEKTFVVQVFDLREREVSPEAASIPSAPWLDEAQPLGEQASNWFRSPWFGDFYRTDAGWLYHLDLGWVYPVKDDADNFWLWRESHGWLWTGRGVYRHLYRHQDQAWLYFLIRKDDSPRFYNHATAKVE